MRRQFLRLALLLSLLSLPGCLFGVVDLRRRSAEMPPVEVGFEAPSDALAARLATYIDGSPAGRRYGTWKAVYPGEGNALAAVLAWGRHSMTAQVAVEDGQVEISVLESENLNEKEGRLHKAAVANLKVLRKTVIKAIRTERANAKLSGGAMVMNSQPQTAPAPAPSAKSTPARIPAPELAPQALRAAPAPPPLVPVAPSPSDSLAGIDVGRFYALVIGNNGYSNLPRLRTPVPDAAVVSSVLELDYGFDVQLLTDATRGQIVSALNSYRSRLTANDNLLVYYAGHGWFDGDAERGYWLPVDARDDDPSNWLSNVTITDLVRALPAKHVMVVADSCYSGTLTRGINMRPAGNNYLAGIARKRARTVLTSGGLEPVEDGSGKHSVFAGAFIEALRTNPTVMDGQTLFGAIRRPVMLDSDQTPEYGDIRRAGHDGGDFLFIRQR